jgi:uncharacterized protein (DUF2062 family)
MPRKIIRRFLPDHHEVRKHQRLRHFGSLLHDPNIWHLNRRSVSWGSAVGIFFAFFPFVGQTLLAAGLAIALRVNLPLAVLGVWITNPLTAAPVFYGAYLVGNWVLATPAHDIGSNHSTQWFIDQLGVIWQPFLLGCLICGLVSATVGFFLIRMLWRWRVVDQWQKRRDLRT